MVMGGGVGSGCLICANVREGGWCKAVIDRVVEVMDGGKWVFNMCKCMRGSVV